MSEKRPVYVLGQCDPVLFAEKNAEPSGISTGPGAGYSSFAGMDVQPMWVPTGENFPRSVTQENLHYRMNAIQNVQWTEDLEEHEVKGSFMETFFHDATLDPEKYKNHDLCLRLVNEYGTKSLIRFVGTEVTSRSSSVDVQTLLIDTTYKFWAEEVQIEHVKSRPAPTINS